MRYKFPTIALICTLLFAYGCTNKIGEQLMTDITESDTDSVIITSEMALFVFNIDQKKSWHWFQQDTRTGMAEYGWWAEFELANNRYSCGYRLFKHPFTEPSEGSFKQLIEAGQVDIFAKQSTAEKRTGDGGSQVAVASTQKNDIQLETVIEPNHLIIVLEEQHIINQFRDIRPDSILFHKQTGARQFDRSKIAVNYRTDAP